MEFEVPAQTIASISFISTALLTFFLSLSFIDEDLELTLDNTLAPPFELKNYNVNFPINQY
jgi:hypothetical protein